MLVFGHAGSDPTNPAPGYRDYGCTDYEGVARLVGDYGYSWSSAASGTDGVFLSFGTQGLTPSSVLNRGLGLQLRCLSE
ncbi:hypothetical protein [uncultured Rikenella sp.]|uniref:hypothetical protein n=1 Tax=uncultured Rikenella sp. TaxID=368003 RepID=UPI0025E02891|nr:hypothetical protein [uncultured Rikenella sp.]